MKIEVEVGVMIPHNGMETAEEMHKRADQSVFREAKEMLEKLMQAIRCRADNGFYRSVFSVEGGKRKESYLEVKQTLETLGYKVVGDCDEVSYSRHWTIAW